MTDISATASGPPVFVDQRGRRHRVLTGIGVGGGLLLTAYLVVVVAALTGAPWVPAIGLPGVDAPRDVVPAPAVLTASRAAGRATEASERGESTSPSTDSSVRAAAAITADPATGAADPPPTGTPPPSTPPPSSPPVSSPPTAPVPPPTLPPQSNGNGTGLGNGNGNGPPADAGRPADPGRPDGVGRGNPQAPADPVG